MTTLEHAPLELLGMLPGASNYTLLARLRDISEGDGGSPSPITKAAAPDGAQQLVVYKPRRGETPLWDFPSGTLCRREVAAYVVARAGGWDFIPPTVLRDGPLGVGAVQSYIEHDPAITAFELIESHRDQLQQIAVFDLVANNADRKAGHVLLDSKRRLWGVDHGLCFHEEPKLRTVLWDFIGDPISVRDLELVQRLCRFLEGDIGHLASLLSPREIEALAFRARTVLEEKTFPPPRSSRPYPWPPV